MTHDYNPGEQSRALALRDDEERSLTPVQVVPPKRLLPTMQELDVMARLAKNLSSARGFAVPKGVDHPAKAFAIIYAGYEVGIGPMMAFRHISSVNGQTQFDAQLMMGICKARDASVEFIFHQRDAKGCKVELRRGGASVITVEFREEDAKRAKLFQKAGPWTEHPDLMYAYAAVKRAVKLGASDLAMAIDSAPVGMAEAMMPDEIAAPANEGWETLPAGRNDVDADTGELTDVGDANVAGFLRSANEIGYSEAQVLDFVGIPLAEYTQQGLDELLVELREIKQPPLV